MNRNDIELIDSICADALETTDVEKDAVRMLAMRPDDIRAICGFALIGVEVIQGLAHSDAQGVKRLTDYLRQETYVMRRQTDRAVNQTSEARGEQRERVELMEALVKTLDQVVVEAANARYAAVRH